MDKLKLKVAGVGASVAAFLASSVGVVAQDYDWEYSTTTSTGDAASEGLVAGMGIFMILIWCGFVIFGIANLVIWIMSLIHCIQNAPDDKKTMWLLIIILVPFGSWVYFFTKKKEWSK